MPLRLALGVALVATWAAAAWWWPQLPDRLPVHFDARGVPDGFAPRSAGWWFLLPALATVLGLGLGVLLPRWVCSLARRNSPWLNVPHKARFAALPEAARVRAVAAPAAWLRGLALLVALLLLWLVNGSALVAVGTWQVLPPLPSYLLIGAVVAGGAGLAFAGSRAVQREVARLGGDGPPG